MEILVSNHFFPLLDRKERYLILCGGAGSGKSEFAGRKIFYRCMTEGGHRFLVLRKIRKTVEESCVELIRCILANNNVVHNYNKSERVITFINPAGKTNEILFDGLDDPEKIKSIKGITSIWMEELTEFTRQDFIQVDLRLREETGLYQQIMASFNPDEALGPWIKADFFDQQHADSFVHVSTVEHNPIKEMREKYVQILDRLNDATARKIYRLGLWALPTGRIFNWDVQPLPDIRFDEIIYGGDFGYSVDPAAFIKIYRKAVKVHVVQGSLNIISEQGSYRWKKDKLDNDLPEPVAFKNHAMDAVRYGIYTHCKQAGAAFRVISHNVSPV